MVREARARGKHRTEVTEGDLGFWSNVLPGTPLGWVRKTGVQPSAFSGSVGFFVWAGFLLVNN
jgi:hypothetical protein